MKANELMIGDWVRKLEQGGHTIPVKIVGYLDNEVDFVRVDGMRSTIDIKAFEPIPLTPEILEKNGFTRSRVFVEWKYNKDDTYILWKPFPWVRITREESDICFTCEYVHELQHALRLCGLTAMADNFEI